MPATPDNTRQIDDVAPGTTSAPSRDSDSHPPPGVAPDASQAPSSETPLVRAYRASRAPVGPRRARPAPRRRDFPQLPQLPQLPPGAFPEGLAPDFPPLAPPPTGLAPDPNTRYGTKDPYPSNQVIRALAEHPSPVAKLTTRALKCQRAQCGYEWIPRVEIPIRCPCCKNQYWWLPTGTLKRGRPYRTDQRVNPEPIWDRVSNEK